VEVDVGTVVDVNVGVGTTVGLATALAMGILVGNNIEEGDTGEQADNKTVNRVRRNEKQGTRNKGRRLFIVKERGICPMITEKARPRDVPSHFLLLTRYSSLFTRYSHP
jgi:hypothetical protein